MLPQRPEVINRRPNHRFSVVTVNYNSGNGLQKTVESVFSQNYKDSELIIIDNVSTDQSGDYLKALNPSDKTTIVIEKDQGIYDAMNKGVGLSTANHIIFMNAGDTFHDDNVLANANKTISDFHSINCGNTFLPREKRLLRQRIRKYGIIRNICHQSIFYNKRLTKRPFFDTRYSICADFKTTLQAHTAKSINHIDVTISNFDTTGVSNKANKQRIRERISIIWKSECSLSNKVLTIANNFRLLASTKDAR